MKCLVTGGAGFIGTNLIKRLLSDGHKVISIDNYTTGFRNNEQNGCHYISADIKDIKFWGRRLEKQDMIPDVVFHLAALPRIGPSFENPLEVLDTNINGTMNMLEFAREFNIPFIYAGSSSVHGGKYKNPYTFSKKQGEDLCKMYESIFNLDISICRFYNAYGDYMPKEGGYRTALPIFIEQYNNKETFTITGDGKQRRDFTHVEDIVDGMVLCFEKKAYGYTFELGRGKNYSIKEVINMFPNANYIFIDAIPGEVKETLADYSLAQEVLNWKPKRNLEDYIREIL